MCSEDICLSECKTVAERVIYVCFRSEMQHCIDGGSFHHVIHEVSRAHVAFHKINELLVYRLPQILQICAVF